MIRRRGQQEENEDSSSGEEDAFTALSRTAKRSKSDGPHTASTQNDASESKDSGELERKMASLPQAITSSMKRHHKPNDDRKARMDALLQELETEKPRVSREPSRFIPDKKGSFVDPSEEHLTTNIFVGNLSPSITEEDLTELFTQFGELYSIKIMWPRTPSERHRNRNTDSLKGFVCFMNRGDAEEAMEACNESDPFNVGRLLMMRWGKDLKRNTRHGGYEDSEMRADGTRSHHGSHDDMDEISIHSDGSHNGIDFQRPQRRTEVSKSTIQNSRVASEDPIRVRRPPDERRYHFISTVASFVAKDGSHLERKLLDTEANNREFDFLRYDPRSQTVMEEHLFYRWRVYSFCQGDSYSNWRTAPFKMFRSSGRLWIPPALDKEASRMERSQKHTSSHHDENIHDSDSRQELMTGRQIELARRNRRRGNSRRWEPGTKLSAADREKFDWLVRKKLTISRESICAAMAFCFEKSGAAHEISSLLKDTLLDDSPNVTMDMRIARLYLLSDILFNSQQPGVRNAFFYRDALEKMAPEIFASLGRHGVGQVGRMTMNKLRTVVSAVLGAWAEWSVYNPVFLDELEARFSGKAPETSPKDEAKKIPSPEADTAVNKEPLTDSPSAVVLTHARGEWTSVSNQDADLVDNGPNIATSNNDNSHDPQSPDDEDLDGSPLDDAVPAENDDQSIDDIDGQPLEDSDLDGSPLSNPEGDKDNALDDDDLDGEALEGGPITPIRQPKDGGAEYVDKMSV